MADYKFQGDFTRAPLGAFTEANKKLVWNDPAAGGWYDADKTGKWFSIVEDARFPGGRACRMFYPQGSYGMKDQWYQVRYKSPQTIVNLEWLWLFEPNFSFYTPVQGGDGGGGTITNPVIITTSSNLQTNESGGSVSFTAVLGGKPTSNVTFNLTCSNLDEAFLSATSLVFTPTNWNIPQTVTVTGVDDLVVDGNKSYTIITSPVVSTSGSSTSGRSCTATSCFGSM